MTKTKKNTSNSVRQFHICKILASYGISLEEFLSVIFYKDTETKREYIRLMFPTFDEERIKFVLRLYENKNIGRRIMGVEKAYVESINKHYELFVSEIGVEK